MTTDHPNYVWWNGKLVPWNEATIHVTDLAWGTIGAVFEGIRAYKSTAADDLFIFRLREHMARLQDSSKIVHLPLPYSVDDLIGFSLDLIRANECQDDIYLFPLVYTSDGSRRFDPSALTPELLITTRAMPSHLNTGFKQNAKTSTWTRISDTVMPPRVKSIPNYRNSQLATHEVRQDGYDVALLLNPQGKVAEAPGACVMHIKNGRLITPDVASGLLESITRDAIIKLAREDVGIEVIERTVDRTELYLADEVFLCGTAAEISPVVSVDKYQIGDGEVGTITQQLEGLLEAAMRDPAAPRPDWRTPVGVPVAVS